jgi:hypothetical protein
MRGENNANVTDEIASRQVVLDIQHAQSTNNDELFASVSAEEHDYTTVNDKCVSGIKKAEKSKKRTVYAPQAERNSTPPEVISVEIDEDEDVEWSWTHTADGKSVGTGYIITKRTDKPNSPEWRFVELPRGHYPMFSRFEDLAKLLLDLPSGKPVQNDAHAT